MVGHTVPVPVRLGIAACRPGTHPEVHLVGPIATPRGAAEVAGIRLLCPTCSSYHPETTQAAPTEIHETSQPDSIDYIDLVYVVVKAGECYSC